MIDPFGYGTSGWLWRHVLYRLERRLLRALGLRRPNVPARADSPGAKNGRKALVTYKYTDHAESSRILRVMVERRVRAHFVYIGGAREAFNHEGQLKAMFKDIDFDGLVTVNHFPHIEHTQMLEGDRRTLVEAIATRSASTGGCLPLPKHAPMRV